MEKFTTLTGAVLPLAIDNLDTDQIIPKQFLRGLDKSGLARGCLYDLRFNADGSPKAGSIFHRPGFDRAAIILGGPNFGCGSSREHAVWSLLQLGIRAVIAPSFGEIFYSNCFNNGLLAAKVAPEASEALFAAAGTEVPSTATIDLAAGTIALEGCPEVFSFAVAERHRTMLLEGLDMVESTLRDRAAIEAFQARHQAQFPWMARLAGRTARTLKN